MLLKSAAVAATVAAVLAAAPAPAMANYPGDPGNCQPGTLCVWPDWSHVPGGPVTTPTVVTTGEWTGNVTGFTFYNHTSRNAEIYLTFTYLGKVYNSSVCSRPGAGDTYMPVTVTRVSWEARTC